MIWSYVVWPLGIVGFAAGLYGLHRLCLFLEARGQLFYLNKKPSGANTMIALKEIIEPTTKYVTQVREQKTTKYQGEAGADRDGAD